MGEAMTRVRLGAWALILCLASLCAGAQAAQAQTPEERAVALVGQMSSGEKLDLVASGVSGLPRLGIPKLAGRDGPNGIGEGEKGVTAFPNAVNIGASWDPRLARRYGAALGGELRAKGFNLLLGPTTEIVRTPLWGRAAETYGEDPFLNGALIAPEIRGVQTARVMAQVKHFVGNNQEVGRFGIPLPAPAVDDRISLRTLEEIYMAPFKAAVRKGGTASVMCSYNRINGTPSCQNASTLAIFKSFGLRGFVAPDATLAIRDLVAAANAGVDNFQLGSLAGNERAGLETALTAGTVSQARIDDAARRILLGMIQTGAFDAGNPTAKPVASTAKNRALATSISAQASVLLRNRGRVLPLDSGDRRIAVIGYDAGKGTQIEEGGSPAVLPGGTVITPLTGIRDRAPSGVKVSYAAGTRGVVSLPIVPASALTPSSGSGQGLSGTFYASHAPCCTGSPVTMRVDQTIDFDSSTDSQGFQPLEPIPGTSAGSARWMGFVTPSVTGEYRFSLTFAGNAKLFIDNKQVIAGDTEFVQGGAAGFPGAPDVNFQGVVRLTAGQKVPIRVEYGTNASIGGAVLKLGWQPPEPSLRAKAVAAARKADLAVVFANDVTAEGVDRSGLSLPGDQNQLIEAVAKANPRTVVVLHTASAVLMPWRKRVAGIVEAWYPGQQSGAAIARTLFGDVDPSGRLPVTFPASESQGPTANNSARYPGINNVAQYSEALQVGYRFYDANGQKPLYPFGFGLSYTRFSLSNLNVVKRSGGRYDVKVRVRNTGSRKGAQVVQLYLGFPSAAGEPPRQLKAFGKVSLGAGRAKTVRLELDRSSFQVFDEASNDWKTTPGTYRIFVGTSSRNLPLQASVAIG